MNQTISLPTLPIDIWRVIALAAGDVANRSLRCTNKFFYNSLPFIPKAPSIKSKYKVNRKLGSYHSVCEVCGERCERGLVSEFKPINTDQLVVERQYDYYHFMPAGIYVRYACNPCLLRFESIMDRYTKIFETKGISNPFEWYESWENGKFRIIPELASLPEWRQYCEATKHFAFWYKDD